jgi:hypothetical protein
MVLAKRDLPDNAVGQLLHELREEPVLLLT